LTKKRKEIKRQTLKARVSKLRLCQSEKEKSSKATHTGVEGEKSNIRLSYFEKVRIFTCALKIKNNKD
jgi:hypothetical protein